MLRPRPAVLLAIATVAAVGCGTPGGRLRSEAMPAREDDLTFLGAGRERIDRHHFEPVVFAAGSWRLVDSERAKVARIAVGLGGQRRAVIAGMGDEGGPDEFNRVLGEARAQTVRHSLIAAGVGPGRLQTVSFGGAWPGGSDVEGLSRVVVGLVK